MVRKWLPQSDILAHKNVILFISHGGLFGSFEGAERGKPMLYIPLYGDQYRNALRAEKRGYALKVAFLEITTDYLYSLITELINNKKYSDSAKKISSILRDNPIHAMDESMFWIEYVARHKGAAHLKSHAVNMSWFSYLLLDIVAVLLLGLLAVYLIISKVLRALFSKSKPTNGTESKKKKRN